MDFVHHAKVLFPEQSVKLEVLGSLYEKRLWHQLTIEIGQLLKDNSFQLGDYILNLYTDFINLFEEKLNGVHLANLVAVIGGKLSDRSLELSLYQRILNSDRKFDEETRLYLKLCVAYVLLVQNQSVEAQQIINEAKQAISTGSVTNSHVYSRYYKALSEYHQLEKKFTEFYSTALLYLSYSNILEIDEKEKKNLALRVALSSVLSDSVFDFAVFLQSSLLSCLDGEHYWLQKLVHLMNDGDVNALESLISQHRSEINKVVIVSDHWSEVHAKVVHLAVLNLVLSLNPHDRNISFSTISQKCLIAENEVESVLMKLMSKNLMRGRIDEVSKTLKVDWIQPRELGRSSILSIHEQLTHWSGSVKNALQIVEDSSPDMFI